MAKFAWPTFWAALAAVIFVSIIMGLLFRKRMDKKTGEVKLEFRGAMPLSGYQDLKAA